MNNEVKLTQKQNGLRTIEKLKIIHPPSTGMNKYVIYWLYFTLIKEI